MSEMKTFVFTDIVKSVTLKGQMAGRSDAERDEAYVTSILTPHRQFIEDGLAACGGRVVSTAGDGHFLVFDNTIRSAAWAVQVQQAHRDQPIATTAGEQVEVRMSLHVGFPQADPGDPDNFIGRVVDYAARLNDYATGGQVLVSAAALGLLKDAGLEGVEFHPHGERELRGIGSVEVYELLYDGSNPRTTRDKPKQKDRREWSVLPATMGLTEYAMHGGSSSGATQLSPAKLSPSKQRLGNYQLEEMLGAGGMGNVYKARHVQFDRVRAIKVIKPHFLESGNQAVIQRFYREIKAIGALDHPNIVVAIDSSAPSDHTHYLVMEYVRGVSAEDLVKREGPLLVPDACEVIRQAAVGLDYILSQGMVHRDIKPSNLMLTLADSQRPGGLAAAEGGASQDQGEPVVKILDLGLALLVDEDQSRFTQMDHGAMGTAMYMSPEQWKTTSVDIRSDIYSLGCSLFHLLTGSPPFFDSDLKPEKAHERLAPPSLRGCSDVPKQLDVVVRKMMAKRATDRYQTPAEVAAALTPLAQDATLRPLILCRRRSESGSATEPNEVDETLSGAPRERDTMLNRRRIDRTSWLSNTTAIPMLRRWAAPVWLVGSLTAVFLLVWGMLALRSVLQETRMSKLADLTPLAAQQLEGEINNRFNALSQASEDPTLIEAMVALEESPDDWAAVQKWIERQMLRNNERLPANSWFITDQTGQQIARSPRSDSIGNSYWQRDYFHGQGKNLEDSAPRPDPLPGHHLSSVYRSSSTKQLKVAFSVPIWNGERRPADRKILGVLAMSIELGDFEVLERSRLLTKPLQLVLVDLRQGEVEDEDTVGLVLHHPELGNSGRAYHLPEAPLAKVVDAIEQDRLDSSERLILGYPDVLGRRETNYWGGFYPLDVPSQNQPDAKWLVIIQEPMP